MSDSLNDTAWQKIFDKYDILPKIQLDGFTNVTATQLNEFRQARLMTKFDHQSQLPKIFTDNSLSILPISRGSYVLGQLETFHKFEKSTTDIIHVEFPPFIQSLNYREISSEATAINCAFVAKILHDFTAEVDLYPTVSGRMSSSTFECKVSTSSGLLNVRVENSQLEIDGGYEGESGLILLEAKNYISGDFLIRQLYYPYVLWSRKIGKTVRPIFLTYSNGIFHLREYVFDDINHYNSVRLIRERKYSIQETSINMELVQRILDEVRVVPEPEIPFPQADSFARVINLLELLKQKGSLLKAEITSNYDFDQRQTNYYTRAVMYLGLAQIKAVDGVSAYVLTEEGERLFSMALVDRQIEFIKRILSHAPFNKVLKLHLTTGMMPSKDAIVEIMKECKVYRVGEESTYLRRASSIKGWINWILGSINE